jgi:hypothetical protein
MCNCSNASRSCIAGRRREDDARAAPRRFCSFPRLRGKAGMGAGPRDELDRIPSLSEPTHPHPNPPPQAGEGVIAAPFLLLPPLAGEEVIAATRRFCPFTCTRGRSNRGFCSFPRLRGKAGMGAGSREESRRIPFHFDPTHPHTDPTHSLPNPPQQAGEGVNAASAPSPRSEGGNDRRFCPFPRLRGKAGMGAGPRDELDRIPSFSDPIHPLPNPPPQAGEGVIAMPC